MVSTRSKETTTPSAGDKRPAPTGNGNATKKAKHDDKDGKLEIGKDGDVGLKKEEKENDDEGETDKGGGSSKAGKEEERAAAPPEPTKDNGSTTKTEPSEDRVRSGEGETKQEGDETDTKARASSPGAELEEPKHGTLESGHVYFLYRPKIDAEEVDSVDDISKFHILLIPTSAPHHKGHYHRIIEVGKKKLPDPGAKKQVIWGLVGGVGSDKGALKEAFGAYEYDTKTRGRRHQPAARPAARGHYILHSPRDELADDPNRNRQRDFKILLAYEITTPNHEDFGNVQSELGIEEKGAVLIQVKDPNVPAVNNPRAASIPREKRAQYPDTLQNLFSGRRFIPANPPAFLNYPGSELLILTSPHELHDSLGKQGEQVEHDLDTDAEKETVSIDEAMKELGMSKKDTDIEALEGAWA